MDTYMFRLQYWILTLITVACSGVKVVGLVVDYPMVEHL
jgi:hypothetical protein